MEYLDRLNQAIIECNIILSDWINAGKDKSKIMFDLNGMLKSVIIKNLKTSDYKTNNRIANSVEFEGVLNENNLLKSIVVRFTHSHFGNEIIYDNIRKNIMLINFNELANTSQQIKKPINELEEINFETIKQIQF